MTDPYQEKDAQSERRCPGSNSFGLAQALQLAKTDVNQAVQDGGKGATAASGGGWMRTFLIVGQIALTMVLLAGAGVAIRGFIALTNVTPGYRPENVLTSKSIWRRAATRVGPSVAGFVHACSTVFVPRPASDRQP